VRGGVAAQAEDETNKVRVFQSNALQTTQELLVLCDGMCAISFGLQSHGLS